MSIQFLPLYSALEFGGHDIHWRMVGGPMSELHTIRIGHDMETGMYAGELRIVNAHGLIDDSARVYNIDPEQILYELARKSFELTGDLAEFDWPDPDTIELEVE